MDDSPTMVDVTDAGLKASRDRVALEETLRESVMAEARRDIALANKQAAEARVAQLSSLLPDMRALEGSTPDVDPGVARTASPLTYRAVQATARQVAAEVEVALGDTASSARILITTETDLVAGDTTYWDVRSGLAELITAADAALLEPAGPGNAMDPVSALAASLPSAISLLSAQRTSRTASHTAADLAAVAAVAGRLRRLSPDGTIVHDELRLLPAPSETAASGDSSVYGLDRKLCTKKAALTVARMQLTQRYAGEPHDNAAITARLAVVDATLSAIDAFTAAVRAVPRHGRSALATAALYEQLHADGFSHALLVKCEPGETEQSTTNRPRWLRNYSTTMVGVAVTYVLVRTEDSGVVAAGTPTAMAVAHGKVGEPPMVSIEPEAPLTQ